MRLSSKVLSGDCVESPKPAARKLSGRSRLHKISSNFQADRHELVARLHVVDFPPVGAKHWEIAARGGDTNLPRGVGKAPI